MAQKSIHHTALSRITVGATVISFSGTWVAWSAMDPTVSAFYRVFFGTCFLLLGCLWRNKIKRLDPLSIGLIILCGLCFAADLICWHTSIQYIGPGLATIIGNFQVFILTFISILFLGERITLRFVVSVPLAIVGLCLVIGFNWRTLPAGYQMGIGLGLATAVFYAGFILTLRRLLIRQKELSFFYSLMLVSAVSSLWLLPAIVVSGASLAIVSPASLGSLLCLALFSQTIGWAFIANSLPKVPSSIAGLILLLQPALAFVWDVLIFDRPASLLNWTGLLIVLAAIYLGMTSKTKSA